MKINIFIIAFSLIFISLEAKANISDSEYLNSIIDSLKIYNDTLVIYSEYSDYSNEKTYIAYAKGKDCFLTTVIISKKRRQVLTNRINIGIRKIYSENFEDIIYHLSNKVDVTIDTVDLKNGNIQIHKLGASHGRRFYFRIVTSKINVEKEYCCGLVPNHFFINRVYSLWLLMSAFIQETVVKY